MYVYGAGSYTSVEQRCNLLDCVVAYSITWLLTASRSCLQYPVVAYSRQDCVAANRFARRLTGLRGGLQDIQEAQTIAWWLT